MNTITESYSLKWQHADFQYYQWTECGKLFNLRTGRKIKKVLNGGSIGYWIKGKFITLSKLRSKLQRIPKTETPF